MRKSLILFLGLLILPATAYGYQWPVSGRYISGSLGEMRGDRHHFHNGIDILATKGSSVYIVESGSITAITPLKRRTVKNENEFVRIGKFAYVHIKIRRSIIEKWNNRKKEPQGIFVPTGTLIGTTKLNHAHLTEGLRDYEVNSLRLKNRGEPTGGLSPFTDISSPTIRNIILIPDFDSPWTEPNPFPKENDTFVIKGKVDIIATAIDKITGGTPSAGIYFVGYEVFAVGNPTVPVKSAKENIVFDGLPGNRDVKGVYAEGSFISPTFGQSVFRYIASNRVVGRQVINDFWDTTEVPNGEYLVKVTAKDADLNGGSAFVKVKVDNVELPIIFDEQPVGEVSEVRPKISAKIFSPAEIAIGEAVMYLAEATTEYYEEVAHYYVDTSSDVVIKIEYTPEQDLKEDTTYYVKVEAQDILHNNAEPKEWTFFVLPVEGFIYVTDFRSYRIVKTKMDGSGWQTLGGTYGSGQGQFGRPIGIDYDDTTGFVYVADDSNHRIVKTKMDGSGWQTFGTRGSGWGQFHGPFGIDYDGATGFVYVTDIWNNRIVKTRMDGSGWQTFAGQFGNPMGIDYDGTTGFVYVADTYNHRIVKTKMNGEGWASFGTWGYGQGHFFCPMDVDYDDTTGFVYVADTSNSRVVKTRMDSSGWQTFGTRGSGQGQFQYPRGIDYNDATGAIHVADSSNYRIIKTDIYGEHWAALYGFSYTWGISYGR